MRCPPRICSSVVSNLFLLLLPSLAFCWESSVNLSQASLAGTPTSSVEDWSFTTLPSPDDSYNFIFDSVYNLLQTWGSTRFYNGHTIVPGTIPKGTLLYHGRHDSSAPTVPDWVAVDPEHAYIYCTSLRSHLDECWVLTFVTTRDLDVLYFDGASAGKMEGGSMDSQDIPLWGKVRDDRRLDERRRIEEMCAQWGKGGGSGGVDGFVRMELDFEVMVCDFREGLEVVSASNLAFSEYPEFDFPLPPEVTLSPTSTPPLAPLVNTSVPDSGLWQYLSQFLSVFSTKPEAPPEPSPTPRLFHAERPPTAFVPWGPGVRGMYAGLKHSRFPGESRIKLNYARLISFYDTDLFPSLVQRREGKERWEHRLEGMSAEDVGRLRSVLSKSLGLNSSAQGKELKNSGSGLDWKTLFHVVQQQYANELKALQNMLPEGDLDCFMDDEDSGPTDTVDVKNVHGYLAGLLRHFTLNSTRPSYTPPLKDIAQPRRDCYCYKCNCPPSEPESSEEAEYAWATQIYARCSRAHSSYMHLFPLRTRSEETLLLALRGVEKEICRVTVGMWAEGVELGADSQEGVVGIWRRKLLVKKWKSQIDELVKWLDWTVWLKCSPACRPEEVCYLPTWPFFPIPKDDDNHRYNDPPGQKIQKNEHNPPVDPTWMWSVQERLKTLFPPSSSDNKDIVNWKRSPQPRCFRRTY